LEVEETGDGRTYALIAITLYPPGIHSFPPAPAAGFTIYNDGVVTGRWANGAEFTLTSSDIASMPPNTSLERTRDS
jgi:hypothetical protein